MGEDFHGVRPVAHRDGTAVLKRLPSHGEGERHVGQRFLGVPFEVRGEARRRGFQCRGRLR